MNRENGEKLKKILSIDGKTLRGNTRNGEKPCHIVSAWNGDEGFRLGQTAVDENTAIPALLDHIHIRGQVVTIDAMGTQTKIAEKIRLKRRITFLR